MKNAQMNYMVAVFVAVFLSSSLVQADFLTGNSQQDYHFKGMRPVSSIDPANKAWREETYWAGPTTAENKTTGEYLSMFCIDMTTPLNPVFHYQPRGMEYNGTSFNDSDFLSDWQKTAINSLFSYVYTSVIDDAGNVLDNVAAAAFQLSLWEIMHEDARIYGDMGGNLTKGRYQIEQAYRFDAESNTYVTDTVAFAETTDLISDWFYAINNEERWEELGYSYTDLQLMVYTAEGGTKKSQTLIGVTNTATPEPATLAVLGLGLVGLGTVTCRRRK